MKTARTAGSQADTPDLADTPTAKPKKHAYTRYDQVIDFLITAHEKLLTHYRFSAHGNPVLAYRNLDIVHRLEQNLHYLRKWSSWFQNELDRLKGTLTASDVAVTHYDNNGILAFTTPDTAADYIIKLRFRSTTSNTALNPTGNTDTAYHTFSLSVCPASSFRQPQSRQPMSTHHYTSRHCASRC